MWDLWWVFHYLLAYWILKRKPGAWFFAMGVSLAELVIIVVKFFLFLQNPVFNFWSTNWVINKSLLLVYFTFLLSYLMRKDVYNYLTKGGSE